MRRIGSPCPRPPGSFEASRVKTLPSLASTRIFEVVSAKNEVFKPVVALERGAGEVRDLTLHRPDPTFKRYDDGQRLALDHRFREISDDNVGRRFETGAATAKRGVGIHRGRQRCLPLDAQRVAARPDPPESIDYINVTAPRRRLATRSSSVRSNGCSAGTPTSCRCRRRNRRSVICSAPPAASKRSSTRGADGVAADLEPR